MPALKVTLRGVLAVLLSAVLGLAAMMGAGAVLKDAVVLVIILMFPLMLVFGVALASLIPLCRRFLPGWRGEVLAFIAVAVAAIVLGTLLEINDPNQDNMLLLGLAFALAAVPVHRLVAGPFRH